MASSAATPAPLHLQEIHSGLPRRIQLIANQQPAQGDSAHRVFSDIITATCAFPLAHLGEIGGVTHYADRATSTFVLIWLHSDDPNKRISLRGHSKVRALSALRFNRDRGSRARNIYAIITVPWSMTILRFDAQQYEDISSPEQYLTQYTLPATLCWSITMMHIFPPIGTMTANPQIATRIREQAMSLRRQFQVSTHDQHQLPIATRNIMTFRFDMQSVLTEAKVARGRELLREINEDPADELSEGEDPSRAVPFLDDQSVSDEQAALYCVIVTMERRFAQTIQEIYWLAKDARIAFHRRHFASSRELAMDAHAIMSAEMERATAARAHGR